MGFSPLLLLLIRLVNQRLMEEQSQVEELQKCLQEQGSTSEDVSSALLSAPQSCSPFAWCHLRHTSTCWSRCELQGCKIRWSLLQPVFVFQSLVLKKKYEEHL